MSKPTAAEIVQRLAKWSMKWPDKSAASTIFKFRPDDECMESLREIETAAKVWKPEDEAIPDGALKRMDSARHLLPEPGPEVVGRLIQEIHRLKSGEGEKRKEVNNQ